MTLRKRLIISIPVFFTIFAGLPNCCLGDANCGFDSNCPHFKPPCYKVTFEGVRKCPYNYWTCTGEGCGTGCELVDGFNGTWILTGGSECEWTRWKYVPDVGGEWPVYLFVSDANTIIFDHDTYYFYGEGPPRSGSCANYYPDVDSCCTDCFVGSCGFSGTATYEPIWDCSACDPNLCSTSDITKSPDTTIHFANESCCPTAGTGEKYTVVITCNNCCANGTTYVVPTVSDYDPNLVRVKYDPNCRQASSASFTLTGLSGKGDEITSVTCTASFFCSLGGTDSGSTTVTVKAHCGECCEPGKKGDPADCPPVVGSI